MDKEEASSVVGDTDEEDEEDEDDEKKLMFPEIYKTTDVRLVNEWRKFSRLRVHCVYIFVLPPVTSFEEFWKGVFYVGQGDPARFELHWKSNSTPMEKRMRKARHGFWGEILWSRLTKDEADYLENALIVGLLKMGKHLYKNGVHDCEKDFTSCCLCNQKFGNNSDVSEPHPLITEENCCDLNDAYSSFKSLTFNASQLIAYTKLYFI